MASTDSIIDMEVDIASGDSIINSNFNEEKWISNMKCILNKEDGDGDETDNGICIYQVPKSIKVIKPEAYFPQRIALGPHHQFFPKLYKMQKCKLHQVQILHDQLNLPAFQFIFDQINRKVSHIRGCYYEKLDIHDDTLSWIMVIDGLFLLQLLIGLGNDNANSMEFVDSLGRNVPIEAILNDVVMIENQIPFFVLEYLLAMSKSQIQSLFCLSVNFCPIISPVVLGGSFFRRHYNYPFHLLDLIYNLVLLGGIDMNSAGSGAQQRSGSVFCDLWGIIQTLNIGILFIPVTIINLVIKIFQVLGISVSFQAVEEKGLIPTALQLSRIKVEFCSTRCGTADIAFLKRDVTLRLPVLKLNVTSEVIIRNLMLYETISRPGTLNFARYIELMGALIHTVEDAELLKSKKILMHDGKSDEIVNFFSGIKSSIPSQGKADFDSYIKDLNGYYNSHWKIGSKKLLDKYVNSSWKMLTILATILLLLLMTLQTFCSIYNCHGIFKTRLSSFILRLASSF